MNTSRKTSICKHGPLVTIPGLVMGLFVLLFSAPNKSTAQTDLFSEDWRWVHFTTECGLPSNKVTDIIETTDGTPWAVTSGGLAWYDGFEWHQVSETSTVFKKPPEWVVQGTEDTLLAVVSGKLYCVAKHGWRYIPLQFEQRVMNVDVVFPMKDHRWMVAEGDRLFIYDRDSMYRLPIPAGLKNLSALLYYTKGREIWINAKDGLYRWDGKGWSLKLKGYDTPYKIVCLIEDENGTAAASIFDPLPFRGLWECREAKDQLYFDPGGGQALITTMDISPSGEMIAHFESGDIRIHSKTGWRSLPASSAELHNALFMKFSQNGNLWVGNASGLHLYRYSSPRWSYWKHPFPDLRNTVHEIVRASDGSLLLGTTQGLEIHRPQGKVELIDRINGTKIFGITGVCQGNDGSVWISSGSQFAGAYRWKGSQWKHFGPREGLNASRIHKIRRDLQGRLWFLGMSADATDPNQPGAFLYDNDKFTQWGGLPNGRVYSFVQSKDSSLWFGTLKGLFRWRRGDWTTFHDLQSVKIFSVALDSTNKVWFGINNAGPMHSLGYVDERDSVHFVTATDRHIDCKIWDLGFDKKGALWLSTRDDEGVLSFRDGIWSSFNLSTGLNSPKLWPILPVENRLYVGTDGNGVNILNFGEATDPLPRIRIDQPVIDGTDALIRCKAFTYWGEVPMSDIKVRYRLDEDPWSDWTAQHDFKLSQNSIGSHRLRLQAKGLFGSFDSLGQAITFDIVAPFYQRPMFALPMSILSVAVVYLGVTLIVRKRKHDVSLRRSEAKFRRLTEATFEGIAIHDRGKILDANPGVLKIFGYEHHEFVGRSALDFTAPESRGIVTENMLSDSEKSYEAVGVRRDGSRIIVEIIGKTIPYGNGTARVVAIRDITKRKQAEEQLLAYQEKLQSLASELSLTEERERRRMATYLHDYIGQALAMCRMKLGLKGSAVSQDELDDVRKYIDQASQHTQSLTFELSPPILYELSFEDAVEWLTEQMSKEHNFPIYFHDDESKKELDLNRRNILYSAIRETLINIVKHAEAHSAKVSLEMMRDAIIVTVQDDGKGFDTSRLNNHAMKNGSFGLFNVRERIGRLGGQLKIESRLGEGTSVTLTIPLGNLELSTSQREI